MTIIPEEEPDFTQAVLDQNSVSKYKQIADFWKQKQQIMTRRKSILTTEQAYAIDSNLFQLSNGKSLQRSDSIGNKVSVNKYFADFSNLFFVFFICISHSSSSHLY